MVDPFEGSTLTLDDVLYQLAQHSVKGYDPSFIGINIGALRSILHNHWQPSVNYNLPDPWSVRSEADYEGLTIKGIPLTSIVSDNPNEIRLMERLP